MFKIIESFSPAQIRQVHALYQHEWWTIERTLKQTRKAIEHSQICLGIEDKQGDIVGFSRVLTDFVFKAIVFDVIVARQMRSRKLGRMILERLVHHPQLKNTRHLELYCLPELAPFYETCGFNSDVAGVQLMRRISLSSQEGSSC